MEWLHVALLFFVLQDHAKPYSDDFALLRVENVCPEGGTGGKFMESLTI